MTTRHVANGQFLDLDASGAIPSSYSPPSNRRPAPPSVRRLAAVTAEPDRQFVDKPEPPERETTLRSRPEPEEPAEVAGKKKRKWSEEQKARLRATLAAKKKRGEPTGSRTRAKKKARKKAQRSAVVTEAILARDTVAPATVTFIEALDRAVREIVADEIRRRLS